MKRGRGKEKGLSPAPHIVDRRAKTVASLTMQDSGVPALALGGHWLDTLVARACHPTRVVAAGHVKILVCRRSR